MQCTIDGRDERWDTEPSFSVVGAGRIFDRTTMHVAIEVKSGDAMQATRPLTAEIQEFLEEGCE
jgi:hypothetical protein